MFFNQNKHLAHRKWFTTLVLMTKGTSSMLYEQSHFLFCQPNDQETPPKL